MTDRYMYDAVNISDIPSTGAQLIGCYTDGTFANVIAAAKRFPHLIIVPIDVNGSNPKAKVLDFEPGDVQNPASAAQWCKDSRAAGNEWPTVYTDRADMPELVSAFGKAGLVLGKDVWLWVSTLDGTFEQFRNVPGVAAVQRTDHGGYDESVVFNDQWMTPAPVGGLVTGIKFAPYTQVAAVNLAWTALPGVAEYTWQTERETATGVWGQLRSGTVTSPLVSVGGLAPKSGYRFRVSGGAWSDWVTFTTP